jgi:nucleoside-diphosphate-sugar epimerase
MPLTEDSNSKFTAAHLHRRHSYGASKYISELLIQHAVHEDALDARIVRPFNAYGPRLPGGAYGQVVAIFLNACLHGRDIKLHGNGEQTRSFTYVDDIVEAIRLTGELDAGIDGSRMAGSTFNIGSVEEISIANLAAVCIEVSGAEISIVSATGHHGDAVRRIPDQSAASAALGWEPLVPLDQGLERCWSWIKSSLPEASD